MEPETGWLLQWRMLQPTEPPGQGEIPSFHALILNFMGPDTYFMCTHSCKSVGLLQLTTRIYKTESQFRFTMTNVFGRFAICSNSFLTRGANYNPEIGLLRRTLERE